MLVTECLLLRIMTDRSLSSCSSRGCSGSNWSGRNSLSSERNPRSFPRCGVPVKQHERSDSAVLLEPSLQAGTRACDRHPPARSCDAPHPRGRGPMALLPATGSSDRPCPSATCAPTQPPGRGCSSSLLSACPKPPRTLTCGCRTCLATSPATAPPNWPARGSGADARDPTTAKALTRGPLRLSSRARHRPQPSHRVGHDSNTRLHTHSWWGSSAMRDREKHAPCVIHRTDALAEYPRQDVQ